MADDRKQQEKVMELLGEGQTRRIRLTVLSVWALVGIVLKGLAYWYVAQMVVKEWGDWGILACAVVVGVGILAVGLLGTLLWRRLRGTLDGVIIEGEPVST